MSSWLGDWVGALRVVSHRTPTDRQLGVLVWEREDVGAPQHPQNPTGTMP